MWKDTEYFKNKGELHRCAVFCLLQLGGEIFDTDMVIVDRTLTDICFDNTIVFNEASPGFELRVELYSCSSEDDYSAGSTPRKLASKLSSSLGRSAGKKLRAAMEPGPVIESSTDLGSTVSEILARRMQELELRSQLGTSPTWMSVFEENDPDGAGRPRPCASRLSGHSPRTPHRPPRSPASPQRRPPLSLLSSDASLTSDSDSHCSTSPCSQRHGWPEASSHFPLSSSSPSRLRPRTLSLDAKLSTLRGRRYGGGGGGGGTLQCPCQQAPSSLLAPFPVSSFSPRSQRSTQTTLSCSSSTSSNSSSNSEGGHSLESSEGAPFSRPSPARRSLRNLKARLDPRNWLQSQV
ncbi:Rhotekin-2 [Liparis tanakae]|uniref:Rhotekin-2 n=1 Tax=Liparis tanakae TaxID=230148 RepID=A0A4Z2G9M7_9TELE|nr:Rhotekin-2 [Liparis tanakae]